MKYLSNTYQKIDKEYFIKYSNSQTISDLSKLNIKYNQIKTETLKITF